MVSKRPQALRSGRLNRLFGCQVVHVVLIVSACVCLFVVAYPGSWFAQKVSTMVVFAQILAFPFILGVGFLICSVTFLILCKAKSGGSLAVVSCVVWVVVALAFFIFPYGVPVQRVVVADAPPQRVLSVVTFNTGSTLTPDGFQELIGSFRPDVIVLPETSAVEVHQVLKATSFAGTVFETPHEGFTSTYNGSIAPTTVVVSKGLGVAQPAMGPATSFGTVAIEFEQPGLPTIIGVHTAPPLLGLMHAWEGDLERVVEFGETSTKPLIIAGDFNATLRHGALAARSRLADAQEFCSVRYVGTWNSQFPEVLRTPIDHVLISPGLQALSCQTMRIGQSDHVAFGTKIAVS